MQSNAAQQAANTQAAAADKALALQTRQYEEGVARQQPFLDAGLKAQEAYMGELGLSDAAKAGTFQSGFRETPGYGFQVEEGEKGVMNNLAALGMRGSGAGLKALTRFRQGLADQTYNTYLDRLSGVSTGGQHTTQAVNASGQTYANNAGALGMDAAEARASGYAGSTNAWTNALSGLTNNTGFALGMLSNNFGAGFPWQKGGSQNALGYVNPNALGNKPVYLGMNL
jgi:hypothetical protein